MIIVKFNRTQEFLEELVKDADKGGVLNNIVRITNKFQASGKLVSFQHLMVMATYVNHFNQLVQLEHYVGDLWDHEVEDKKVYAKAEALSEDIKGKCQEHLVAVRAGLYEPGEKKEV